MLSNKTTSTLIKKNSTLATMSCGRLREILSYNLTKLIYHNGNGFHFKNLTTENFQSLTKKSLVNKPFNLPSS